MSPKGLLDLSTCSPAPTFAHLHLTREGDTKVFQNQSSKPCIPSTDHINAFINKDYKLCKIKILSKLQGTFTWKSEQ